MLRKLRDLFRPAPAATGHFLNLTTPQLQALYKLASLPEYEVYREALDLTLKLQSEKLLAAGDAFQLARMQGILVGLRAAGTLVDEVLQHEQHVANERTQRAKRHQYATERTAAAAANSLFGTPAWPTQR